jgi:ribonuclease VapC
LTAIVIDTSAIVAILRSEPEKDRFGDTILTASSRFMSAANLQEAGMVIAGRFGDASVWEPLDALLMRLEVEIVAHDATLATIAREAFLRFGKGRHPTGLNFGDCAAYALATANNLPLLFGVGISRRRTSCRPCPLSEQDMPGRIHGANQRAHP